VRNVNSCGLPAKIRTGWESRAKEIVGAIARPANGPFGEMFAASYDPPASTRIGWASKVKVTVAATEKRVAVGACSLETDGAAPALYGHEAHARPLRCLHASASIASFFCRFTNGFTYAGGISRTSWPSRVS